MISRIRDLLLPYNAKNYWEARGKTYYSEYLEKKRGHGDQQLLGKDLLQALSKIKFNSALEIGCGFGRNLQLLKKNFKLQKLAGIDISSTMVEEARKILGSKAQLVVADAKDADFQSSSFDLVFSTITLMHIPPKQINAAISNMLRMSRQHVLLVEDDISRIPWHYRILHARHVFFHDYKKILSNYNLNLLYEADSAYKNCKVFVFAKRSKEKATGG